MDHIFKGKQLLHYLYPLALDKEKIEIFKDSLLEISEAKLKECWRRYEWLKMVEKIYDEIYQEHYDCSQFTKDLILQFKVAEVDIEMYYLQKWIKYWYLLKRFTELYPTVNFEDWTITVEKARSFPIESLYTGKLKRSGSRMSGLCPFHQEKTPSFIIFDSNYFKCFGCSKFGDVIDYYIELKGISFVEAVKELV